MVIAGKNKPCGQAWSGLCPNRFIQPVR